MFQKLREKKPKQQLVYFFIFNIVVLFTLAFYFSTPAQIATGMMQIFTSRDVLISDYFVVANVGAAFFNSALVMSMGFGLVLFYKMRFSGVTIAALYIIAGFALFGKNPLNMLPIILGSLIYAKVHHVSLTRYLYVSFFATTLSPLVTEMTHILSFPPAINIICGALMGILIGYVIIPLSAHALSMHQGYSLFNVGFSGGILGMVIVSVLRSFGHQINTRLMWHAHVGMDSIILFYSYFAIMFIYGFIISGYKIKSWLRVLRHPGRAVADFVVMDGVGPTLMNMATSGIMCLSYIMIIGGSLAGPVVGAIFTVVGFSAFGIHIKNYFPVLIGVILATQISYFSLTTPSVQLAALFAATLSPIAGQFGIIAGVGAGFMHASLVAFIGNVYGGMNLYNNGFAAGFVAIIMVPAMEAFIQRFDNR